jgi:ABC-type antimicrobial peptide transport system permease subunit
VVKVYAIALSIGVIGLIVVIFGGALGENLGRETMDPARRLGVGGQAVIAGLTGFGMAGLSAEFSTFDPTWQVALLVATAGGLAAALWARYSLRRESKSDAGPV